LKFEIFDSKYNFFSYTYEFRENKHYYFYLYIDVDSIIHWFTFNIWNRKNICI